MKLLESKYYRPTKIMEESYINGNQHITVADFKDELDADDEPFETLLDSSLPALYMHDKVMLRDNLKDFDQCTDYYLYSYSEKQHRFYNSHACYYHAEYDLFILTKDNVSTERNVDVFDQTIINVSKIYYNSKNPNTLESLTKFTEQYLQNYASQEAKISILIQRGNDLTFKKHKINPLHVNLKTMYNPDFLPVHKKVLHDISNNNKGVVMLHGISGSGKTNYLKWLTSQVPNKDFIFVPNNMIHLLLEPSFVNLLIENTNSVIVLEDCENYIAERDTSQNNTDVVASILNITDGMLSDVLECQFICTFNAKLATIDHALLRKGRLIAEYYFDNLDVEQCNAYLKSVDKTLVIDKPMSLAELTNIDNDVYLAKEKDHVFGFIS